ncbi:DUF2510 domain-containing protein [Mycobacterium marseillense]|uniref:DUF2510 domain-containing protein n=1 Tax=Mycobacterium marseillense TaxID=701042 RepID=UPI0011A43417|nr:DUF2510 domain-containing protein [Mycobacterium marseillense]MDM3977356.1 DUF2510 domain-containing protein [Mycobacterium marseillense]
MTGPYRQFSLPLVEHTGAIAFFQQRTYTVTGTLDQCERAYRRAQNHNLLAGWWSVLSLVVMNWAALLSNWGAIRQVRKLAEQPGAGDVPAAPAAAPIGPPPGWYRDPSGPGHRYWDGLRWTSWTNPPSAPPLASPR